MNKTILKHEAPRVLYTLIALTLILIVMAQASVYATANPTNIRIEQSFSTNSVFAEDIFTYVLRTYDSDAPMPPGSSAGGYAFTIAGNNTYDIKTLAFTKAGKYHYEIYQSISVVKPGYTYDRRTYAIEAQVDASLNVLFTARIDKNKVEKIKFENSFSVAPTDPNLMVDPPVIKTVSGSPARDGSFKFTLTASSLSYPMPPSSANGVKTIWITGPGRSTFGKWSYNKTGIYYYTVREENAGERGYAYDTAVYTITDRVTEEYGKLVLSRIVTDHLNKPVSSLDFHNSYSPTGGILGGGNTERENPTTNPNTNLDDGGNPKGNPPAEDNPFANLWDDGNPGGNAEGGGPADSTPAGGSRPGITGPKTGDSTNMLLYIILVAAGAILAAGALIYIAVSGSKKKPRKAVRQAVQPANNVVELSTNKVT